MRTEIRSQVLDECSICNQHDQHRSCNLPFGLTEHLDAVRVTALFPKGTCLCSEGQPAKGVFVLCTGRAKIFTSSADGRSIILAIARPGEIVGLSAVITGKSYDATVETLELTQANFIAADEFLRLLHQDPHIGVRVAHQLSQYCLRTIAEVRALGLSHTVPEKLARLILSWMETPQVARRNGSGTVQITVPSTQEEIAQMIGSTRETVSRTLAEFRRGNVLQIKGAIWTIADPAPLRELVR
jgi:CRP/FNR family transcriptional regulator, cyclic AMP receptor protein